MSAGVTDIVPLGALLLSAGVNSLDEQSVVAYAREVAGHHHPNTTYRAAGMLLIVYIEYRCSACRECVLPPPSCAFAAIGKHTTKTITSTRSGRRASHTRSSKQVAAGPSLRPALLCTHSPPPVAVELEQKFGDSGSRLLLERHGIRIVSCSLSKLLFSFFFCKPFSFVWHSVSLYRRTVTLSHTLFSCSFKPDR